MKIKIAGLLALLCLVNCSYSMDKLNAGQSREEPQISPLDWSEFILEGFPTVVYGIRSFPVEESEMSALATLSTMFSGLREYVERDGVENLLVSLVPGYEESVRYFCSTLEYYSLIKSLYMRTPGLERIRIICGSFALNSDRLWQF